MQKGSILKALLVLLLAASVASQLACTAPANEPSSDITDNQDKTSDTDEVSELPVIEIPAGNMTNPTELKALIDDGSCIVYDTRTYLEYAAGSIPGARNIPFRFVQRRQAELPRDKTVAYISTDDHELSQLYGLLLGLGFDPARILMLEGGVDAWLAAGFELEEYEIKQCYEPVPNHLVQIVEIKEAA